MNAGVALQGLRLRSLLGELKFDPSQPREPGGSSEGGQWVGSGTATTANAVTVRAFHGTNEEFDEFDESRIGSATDSGYLGRGVYFSTDPNVARTSKFVVEADVYLSNPLRIDDNFRTDKRITVRNALGLPRDASSVDVTRAAQAAGYDGVILDYTPAGYRHQEVVVFDVAQISIRERRPVRKGRNMSAILERPREHKAATDRLVGSFEVKAKDAGKRTFTGALSTSHLDLGNGKRQDIVWPGAFKTTLEDFKSASDPYVPLLDSHDPTSILNVFGHLLDGEEMLTGKTLQYETRDGKALKVPEMYLETDWQVIDGPDGDRILDRLRPGSVRKMSMGYMPLQADNMELKSGPARNLREVAISEGSLVVFAMNPTATVDRASVKALFDALRDGTLTEEQEAELRELPEELKSNTVKSFLDHIHDAKALRSLASHIGNRVKRLQEQPIPPDVTPSIEADSQTAPDVPDLSQLDRLKLARLGVKLSPRESDGNGHGSRTTAGARQDPD